MQKYNQQAKLNPIPLTLSSIIDPKRNAKDVKIQVSIIPDEIKVTNDGVKPVKRNGKLNPQISANTRVIVTPAYCNQKIVDLFTGKTSISSVRALEL